MATFREGDAVEYFNGNLAFKPMIGAVGIVSVVTSKWLYVTWVSVPPEANHWDFVRNGAAEHWHIENFRKLGATDGNIREG